LSRLEIDRVYREMVAVADAHKTVTDAELRTIVARVVGSPASGTDAVVERAAAEHPSAAAEVGYGHGV
jgi:hypothetical protein